MVENEEKKESLILALWAFSISLVVGIILVNQVPSGDSNIPLSLASIFFFIPGVLFLFSIIWFPLRLCRELVWRNWYEKDIKRGASFVFYLFAILVAGISISNQLPAFIIEDKSKIMFPLFCQGTLLETLLNVYVISNLLLAFAFFPFCLACYFYFVLRKQKGFVSSKILYSGFFLFLPLLLQLFISAFAIHRYYQAIDFLTAPVGAMKIYKNDIYYKNKQTSQFFKEFSKYKGISNEKLWEIYDVFPDDLNVAICLLKQENASEELLNNIFDRWKTYSSRNAPWGEKFDLLIVSHPNASKDLQLKVMDYSNECVVKETVAKRCNDSSVYERYFNFVINHGNTDAKIKIAKEPLLHPDMLEKLSNDENVQVRMAVAGNPSTPKHILETLLTDTDESVREFAKERLTE
jgi:hypothetical protein